MSGRGELRVIFRILVLKLGRRGCFLLSREYRRRSREIGEGFNVILGCMF